MNRRAILAALTGGATSLYVKFAWAGDHDPGSPRGPRVAAGLHGKVAGRNLGFPDVKLSGPEHQVRSITYSRGAYCVTTADGCSTYFLEADLRFKIDSSDAGPRLGTPVVLPAGTEGDRAWVFFASPEEIGSFIKRDWS